MKCIINGKILLKDNIVEDAVIVFDEKIQKIAPLRDIDTSDYEIIDAMGKYVAPGLVDVHIHGYLGADVSDGDIDGIRKMAAGIISNGVTAWCPTTMTVSKNEIEAAFDSVRAVKNSKDYYGSRILGVNSEGPFINAAKKGAQAEEHILKPDADFIKKHSDIVKLFTVAPEVDGALLCIEEVSRDTDVLISMGHTDASFEDLTGGMIGLHQYGDELTRMVLNRYGLEMGMTTSRLIFKGPNCVEAIQGPFFICRTARDSFESLPPDQLKKVLAELRYPQSFHRAGQSITAKAFNPKHKNKAYER